MATIAFNFSQLAECRCDYCRCAIQFLIFSFHITTSPRFGRESSSRFHPLISCNSSFHHQIWGSAAVNILSAVWRLTSFISTSKWRNCIVMAQFCLALWTTSNSSTYLIVFFFLSIGKLTRSGAKDLAMPYSGNSLFGRSCGHRQFGRTVPYFWSLMSKN